MWLNEMFARTTLITSYWADQTYRHVERAPHDARSTLYILYCTLLSLSFLIIILQLSFRVCILNSPYQIDGPWDRKVRKDDEI